ncbi:MAG: hypothetical protein IJT19_03055 [Bacteroidaceae bacterium]|nr:hypothetical protein [Bacteroidaceae bacterium]
MKQDWTEQMRNKLEGHEQTPPAGLWEAVSEQMGIAPAPTRRTVVLPGWRRWAVAAAVVALVGMVVLYKVNTVPTSPEGAIAHRQGWSKAESLQLVAEEKERRRYDRDDSTNATDTTSSIDVAPTVTDTALPIAEAVPDTALPIAEVGPDTASSIAVSPADTPSRPVRNTERLVATNESLPLIGERKGAVSESEKTARSVSIGLEGSGELLAVQPLHHENRIYTNVYGYRSVPSSDMAYGNSPLYTQTVYSLTDYVTKHYLPVRFGLSVQWHVHPRLAISTGLHYTYLHSEFTIPLYNQTLRDQHLHYLGLPLGLTCQLWGNRRFQVYASAGALLEKCINDRPWQWSVGVAAGAEYRFHRRVGLYAEPSVGYYFDDGTSLQHYYKQHPWAPSIEVGLRLHFKN